MESTLQILLILSIEVRASIWSYGPKCKLLNEFVRILNVIVIFLDVLKIQIGDRPSKKSSGQGRL